MSGILSH